MRRALAALAAASGVILPLVAGDAGAAPRGTIEGRVVNESAGRPQGGVRVTLTSGTAGEAASVVRRATTDARGRYSFEDLPSGNDRFYAIDARYEGGLFSGDAITIPDDTDEEPVIESTLRVWETTTDPSAILIARNSLFLSPREALLAVVESVTIANMSDRAYIGRGGEREGGARSSIGFALPQRVNEDSIAIVDADLNIPEVVGTDFGFGATVAVPPGQTRVTFSYTVRGIAAAYDLSRQALYPTAKVSVYAAPPLDVESNRLAEDGEVEIGETTYRQHSSSDGLEAGDALQVVAIADAGTPRGLLFGMAGALALVAALGLIPLLRRRRAEPDEDHPSPADERDELLADIAELDVRRERGEIDDETWSARRAELKARLLEGSGGEPARGARTGSHPTPPEATENED